MNDRVKQSLEYLIIMLGTLLVTGIMMFGWVNSIDKIKSSIESTFAFSFDQTLETILFNLRKKVIELI